MGEWPRGEDQRRAGGLYVRAHTRRGTLAEILFARLY